MRAQNWTDIMTLLAVMVVSNKMDEKAELKMFEQAALYLRDMAAPNVTLTESFAKDWMSENRADIEIQASSVYYDGAIKRLVKNLQCLANKSDILTAIMKWTLSGPLEAGIISPDRRNSAQHKLRYKRVDDEASQRRLTGSRLALAS
ncbi:MAG: hypothetical protein ABJN69_07665 [Hellea sp.]